MNRPVAEMLEIPSGRHVTKEEIDPMNGNARLVLRALAAGLLGALIPVGASYALILLTQSSTDALNVLWEDKLRWSPIALGFGMQVGMFVVLRKGLVRRLPMRAGRVTTATGGASTMAMVACCAPGTINLVLSLLGISAVSSLMATWTMPLMVASLAINGVGIAVKLNALVKRRRPARRAESYRPHPIPA